MGFGDLSSVVDVHLTSFRGFFLSSMGARFLSEFYDSVLLDETHIALVYLIGEAISGFVVGTTQPAGFYRRTLKRNWHGFLIAAIPVILQKPFMTLRLLRRLVMATGAAFENDQALLMSIAVNPNEQGKGIGGQLIEEFLKDVKSRGCSSVVLTTDAANNNLVNRFYIGMGFRLLYTFTTPEDRQMNEYVYELIKLQK